MLSVCHLFDTDTILNEYYELLMPYYKPLFVISLHMLYDFIT